MPGTQSGPYRSADRGEHWEKVGVPDHGLPVWSVLFHPHDPDVILVGYENCEIYRSDDAGERWTRLPVSVRFPEITTAPGANPAKRVLKMDASVGEPDLIYAAIEVGGTLRSTDGGEHWENLSHGQYLNDDAVDMHGVLASRWRPGTVFGIGRAGMFASADRGDHWRHVPLEPLNAKGQIYCRDIREVPGNPRKLWVAAGGSFQSEVGVLLHSPDGGDSWTRVDTGFQPPHTMFALAFDDRQPAGCRPRPMAARSTAARTAARAGPPTSRRRAGPKSTPSPAASTALRAVGNTARGFSADRGANAAAAALPGAGRRFRDAVGRARPRCEPSDRKLRTFAPGRVLRAQHP